MPLTVEIVKLDFPSSIGDITAAGVVTFSVTRALPQNYNYLQHLFFTLGRVKRALRCLQVMIAH
jgi:hypothetical protein